METKSLKALAIKVLHGNTKGNQKETESFPSGNFLEIHHADNRNPKDDFDMIDGERDSYKEQNQADKSAYGSVKPLALIFAEPCGSVTVPKGPCTSFKWKLYSPTRSLKPFCDHAKKWCNEKNVEGLRETNR